METDLSTVLEGEDTSVTQGASEPQGVTPEPPSGQEQHSTPSEPNEVHGLKAAIQAEREKRRVLEQQLQDFQQRQTQAQQPQQQPQQQRDGKPTPDQFSTYEDYLEALTDYKADLRDRTREERAKQEAFQRQQFEIEGQYSERVAKFAATAPDYHAVVSNPMLPINNAMARIIKEAENGPQIAYYLGKNPHEAARISQLSPVQAAFAMFSMVNNQVNPVENAIQQATQPQKLPGSLSNERAAGSNGKEPFREPSLDELLKKR